MPRYEIHSCEQMIELIQQLGFLPLLVSGIPRYSAEEMADDMARYGDYLTLTSINSKFGLYSVSEAVVVLSGEAGLASVMSVTLKQIFGQIIWVSGFMTFAFLLLDFPRVRTGIEKMPYCPVYGIKMLARLR